MQRRPLVRERQRDTINRIRLVRRPPRQYGQASAEYLVVACALVLALLYGAELPPVAALIAAFKSYFSAYSFALSLP
jgi:hypothetical protein